MSKTANDWRPRASVETLEKRSAIVWQLRQLFHRHGYAEVHTPTISRDTVIDRYIDPIEIDGAALACPQANSLRYFLQTSPEFCMKRLLAAGMKAIYQFCPAYRAGERGQFHNPEFTMLEWYRADEPFEQAIHFLATLTESVLSKYANRSLAKTEVISYQNAFELTIGIDPLSCLDSELSAVAVALGLPLGSSWKDQSRDDWLNLLFGEAVQPKLGHHGPVIVTHYPANQAALALVSQSDQRTAERYELFVEGVELANGYHELLDADELERRAKRVLGERRGDGKADLSTDTRLLDAMRASMPNACGCALGLDRLVMVTLGLESIDQAIAFAIEKA